MNDFFNSPTKKVQKNSNRTCFSFLEYRAAFYLFDRDGNGFITSKELDAIMRTLGFNPNEQDLQQMIFTVDYDSKYNIVKNPGIEWVGGWNPLKWPVMAFR